MTVSVPAAPASGALDAVAATADQLATQAAMAMFTRGGNAVDAAIARQRRASPSPPPTCAGWAATCSPSCARPGRRRRRRSTPAAGPGSGADADALRAEGHAAMPMRHDIRTVTVPGCVDGWIAAPRALRPPRPGDDPGPGDPPGRVRLPGQPAARRLARPARRRRPRAASTSSSSRPRRPARRVRRPGRGADAAGDRRRRPRGVLRRRVRRGAARPRRRLLHRRRPGHRRRPTGSTPLHGARRSASSWRRSARTRRAT